MKVIIKDYPATFFFETKEKLPKFKFDCPIRTKIVQQQIIEQKIETPYHEADHYNVEEVILFEGGEIWELGT